MNITDLIGIIGSVILLIWAVYPEETRVTSPIKSKKNWLFAIWCFSMFIYALLGYLSWSTFIFLLLEVLIMIAITFMMLDIDDRVDTLIIWGLWILLGLWALSLFPNFMIFYFILGMIGLSLGYAYKMFTLRRYIFLTLGAFFLALFSYLGASWIYFRLNALFMVACLYYVIKHFHAPRHVPANIPVTPVSPSKKPTAPKRVISKKFTSKKAAPKKK